jgi:hypothetical protein
MASNQNRWVIIYQLHFVSFKKRTFDLMPSPKDNKYRYIRHDQSKTGATQPDLFKDRWRFFLVAQCGLHGNERTDPHR